MNPTPSGTQRTGRRTAAIGVTAGLLAGGAIGFAVGVPGFTSAASDAGDDAAPAIVVQQEDAAAPDDVTRPEPGARLRELLQDLVDDGTLTGDQADAVADHLAEHRPDRERPRRAHRPGADGEVVAGLIGIDVETLRDELRNGNTLADIATANGVEVQTIVDALVGEAEEHLALAVEHDRLTEAEAAQKAEQLAERITARVNGERPERPFRPAPDGALDG